MEKEQKSIQRQASAMPQQGEGLQAKNAPALQLQANPIQRAPDKKAEIVAKARELAKAEVTMGKFVEEKFTADPKWMDTDVTALEAKVTAGTTVEAAAKELLAKIEMNFINDKGSSTLDLLGAKKSKDYRNRDFHELSYPGNPTNEKKRTTANSAVMDKAIELRDLRAKKSKEKDKTKKADIQKEIDALLAGNAELKDLMDDESAAKRMNADLEGVRPERRANSGPDGVFTQDDLAALDKEGRELAMKFIEERLKDIPAASGHKLSLDAADSFIQMRDDAKADGITISLEDSYRSPKRAKAAAAGGNRNAIAEYSSHSLGLAVDVSLNTKTEKYGTETSTTPMNDVVKKHESTVHKWIFVKGAKYGWFPFMNEPWHWEYNPSGYRASFQKLVEDYITANRKPKATKGTK